ncbi:type II secretion system minor pseudopilin GspK [Endozoicomonas ascidiicola]|uniref:type II secretion system minor pseudopilin GspK n=1 Tax=Endozoicomonas ascidiicola TaxID=1698521 RepID=UPI000AEE2681|nr:type II secretion system minor pseudopilin GspK [Endozoicomonas ascidiicola]
MKCKSKRQTGIALLSILLILSLLIMLSHELTRSFRTQMIRTDALQQKKQAQWYSFSGEQLAIKTLKQTFKDDPETTHLGQSWATANVAFPVEGGQISGYLKDAQSCFNINVLAKPAANSSVNNGASKLTIEGQVFTALLEHLTLPPIQAEQITLATRNWVSSEEFRRGATDQDYLTLPMPYLSGKTQMRDISEWRAVAGVSSSVAQKVIPYLCALPGSELAININTLSPEQPELLAAVYIDQLPVEHARTILERRPRNGWAQIAEFTSQPLLANFNNSGINERLSINSYFFEMSATANYGDSEVRLKSLLARSKDNKLTVIRRKFGGV